MAFVAIAWNNPEFESEDFSSESTPKITLSKMIHMIKLVKDALSIERIDFHKFL